MDYQSYSHFISAVDDIVVDLLDTSFHYFQTRHQLRLRLLENLDSFSQYRQGLLDYTLFISIVDDE
jgi:hypothetical protein